MAFLQKAKVMWESSSSRYHQVTFDKTAPVTVVSGFYAKIYFEIDFVCLYFKVKRCMFEKNRSFVELPKSQVEFVQMDHIFDTFVNILVNFHILLFFNSSL